MHIEKITRDFLIQVGEADPDQMTAQRRAVLDSLIEAGRYTEATEDEILDFDGTFYPEMKVDFKVAFTTELTPEGEQYIIPGAERQTTTKNPQGELFT